MAHSATRRNGRKAHEEPRAVIFRQSEGEHELRPSPDRGDWSDCKQQHRALQAELREKSDCHSKQRSNVLPGAERSGVEWMPEPEA